MTLVRALGVLWLSLAATAASAESVLYRGIFGEPQSLSPNRSGLASEIAIVHDLFVGLAEYDIDGRVAPGLAESWQVSADGLTWTFKLRPGLKWSDGQPLTADDFVFGFRRAVTPATAAALADRLFMLRNAKAIASGTAKPAELGVAAPSPRELVLQLEYPAPRLPNLLLGGIGFPTPQHAVKRWGDAWTRPGRMVSNGAYMLAERRTGESIRLVRNPHFHAADQVRIDTVIYRPSDSVDAQVNLFRTGAIHINRNPGFPPNRKALLEKELGKAVRVSPYPMFIFLRFNLRRDPFKDAAVRRALALAIEPDKIARRVLRSGEQPAYHLVPPMISGYAPPSSPFGQGTAASRLATARQLLAKAGYDNRRPLRFTLRYASGWARETCVAIAAMWSQVGVRVELLNSEAKSLIADVRRGDFDVYYDGALFDEPEAFLDLLQAEGPSNTGGYRSSRYEAALLAAKREPDAERRNALLRAAEAIALADVPIMPLVYSVSRTLVAPKVRGWRPNPMDMQLSRYLSLEP
ncbi:MAG: peptide ABC transporter substrate-binding protein [Steroidobacteraceae bacterium]